MAVKVFGPMCVQQEDGGIEANDGADGRMDGWGRESVSPWQPIANDPTPRGKRWRDERMDGDDGGGGVQKRGKEKEEETQDKEKYKTGEEILLGDV